MTTQRLYYFDAYLTEFDARVAAVRADGWIALDRTAFYPTSGGQPFDTGKLFLEGREIPVTDVTVENGVVWHRVASPLPENAAVRGRIDWARRWDHMQQHAGDHMLAGAICLGIPNLSIKSFSMCAITRNSTFCMLLLLRLSNSLLPGIILSSLLISLFIQVFKIR